MFIVTEPEIWRLHCSRLAEGLDGRAYDVLFYPGGEDHKRIVAVESLCEQMARAGGDRASIVLAFGGGVVNDVAGFAASIFMRGIQVVQIPTTVLAQVDAAIGGKTGVDLACGKNLAGTFHQPSAVLVDPDVLATLPDREYRAGLFEVLKYGVIWSRDLFRIIAEHPDAILARRPDLEDRLISECVAIKAEVVSKDDRESGLRMILNFGHTIGHALEVETGYTRFLHGEAVAFGMRAAAFLARRTGHLSAGDAASIDAAVQAYGSLPPMDGVTAEALTARTVMDKKARAGKVRFVLPVAIGEVTLVEGVDPALVVEAVEEALG